MVEHALVPWCISPVCHFAKEIRSHPGQDMTTLPDMPRGSRRIYCFGDFQCTSLEAAKQFFAQIRKRVGEFETVTVQADIRAIADLLRGHAEYEDKVKEGVKRFFVAPAPDHPNTTCFWLERLGGSTTDFGFPACVQSVGTLNRQSFRALLRPHVAAFKAKRLAESGDVFVSDHSGKTFPASEAHVHHDPEFEEILARFAQPEGIDLETELLTVTCDARSEPQWKDGELPVRFLRFHDSFPLHLVSKGENLSTLRIRRTDL